MTKYIQTFLHRHWFVLGIVIAIPFGYFCPELGLYLFPKSSYLAFTAIFFTTINLDLKRVQFNKKTGISIVLSNVITLVIAPIIFYGVSQLLFFFDWFPQNKDIYLGIAILSVVPTTIVSHIVFCLVAGGNYFLSTMNTVLSNLLSLISIPLFISFMFVEDISLSPIDLLKKATFIILIPIILAQGLKWLLPGQVKRYKKVYPRIGQMTVLLFTLLSVSINNTELYEIIFLSPIFLKILAVIIILHGILLLVAYSSTKIFDLPKEDRISILFSSSQKTLNVSMALIAEFFPFATQGAIVIVLYHTFQLLVGSFIVQKIRISMKKK